LSYLWRETYRDFLPLRVIERISRTWHSPELLSLQVEDPFFFFRTLKDDTGNIIGLITTRKLADVILSLDRLYIHPAYQGTGLGKMLLECALNEFRPVRKLQLEAFKENLRGLDFYFKLGFIITCTKHEQFEGVLLDSIIMEKDLVKPARPR
jgi:ribosomal protein S18 acetylase RimI-like enzyme